MRFWLENEKWCEVASEESPHKKADIFQNTLLEKYLEFFPIVTRIISSDSQPFYNDKLARLKRIKSREYAKHRKSKKWAVLNNPVSYTHLTLPTNREV